MYQKTINKELNFEGIGLHTGVHTKLKLIPSSENTVKAHSFPPFNGVT